MQMQRSVPGYIDWNKYHICRTFHADFSKYKVTSTVAKWKSKVKFLQIYVVSNSIIEGQTKHNRYQNTKNWYYNYKRWFIRITAILQSFNRLWKLLLIYTSLKVIVADKRGPIIILHKKLGSANITQWDWTTTSHYLSQNPHWLW